MTQSYLTLWDPMDCSPPSSSVCGIFHARILEWGNHSLLQGNLPNPGIKPTSPALQVDSLSSEPPGKPIRISVYVYVLFPIVFHYRLLQDIECSSLCYNFLLLILYIVLFTFVNFLFPVYHPLPNLVNISLFSVSVSIFLLCSFVLFFRFYIKTISYNVCLSLSDFLHLIQ